MLAKSVEDGPSILISGPILPIVGHLGNKPVDERAASVSSLSVIILFIYFFFTQKEDLVE